MVTSPASGLSSSRSTGTGTGTGAVRRTLEGNTTVTKTLHLMHARVLTAGDDLAAVAPRRGDSGQGTLEYIGIAVIIGEIIAAIAGSGVADDLAAALKATVTKITTAK